MLFSESLAGTVYVIHDNALMFNIDFLVYNLVSITTAVEAPNMNSIMERFLRTVRREAPDNFLLTGRNRIEGILAEYNAFHNTQRPHQGIQQKIPKPSKAGGYRCRIVELVLGCAGFISPEQQDGVDPVYFDK